MSKYRDRLRIIADILSVANEKARKTRIMYQANLSYRLLCRYLEEVLDAGLVKSEDDDCFALTVKGREFLDKHEEYSKRCRSLEKHLDDVNTEKSALEIMCRSVDATSPRSNSRGSGKRALKN
jgi:predicted transcriptional regulator